MLDFDKKLEILYSNNLDFFYSNLEEPFLVVIIVLITDYEPTTRTIQYPRPNRFQRFVGASD